MKETSNIIASNLLVGKTLLFYNLEWFVPFSWLHKSVLIQSERHPNGYICDLQKDKFGIFWEEGFQKCRPEEEQKLKMFAIFQINNAR